jgi:lipoprotein-releasing system permease protein
MYKYLLCWRYLRTRYIALASIVSVMLGVATMIVVNSVMTGFTTEMQVRIHGILSDMVFASRSMSGFPNADRHMEDIRKVAGEWIEGMTPTVHVPAMLSFQVGGQWQPRQVMFIGIEEATYSSVSDFAKYLQHPSNRERLSFGLRDGGYDVVDHQSGPDVPRRPQMEQAGWSWRRQQARFAQAMATAVPPPSFSPGGASADPFQQRQAADKGSGGDEDLFDPKTEQHPGVILGIALASYRGRNGADRFLILPGDDVRLTFPTAGTPPQAVSDVFTIVDFYESKMSEYDATFVFAPIKELQLARGMYDPNTAQIDPQTGHVNIDNAVTYCSSIQIKLKPGVDMNMVRDKLREHFPPELYLVETWRDKQGPLLAAVQMETAILNVLLFMIIAVAGFGILAIFYMIVVEKTRDIGVLKSLGASQRGILGIFVGYGLSLGLVGSGVGLVLGLFFVAYINELADLLSRVTGHAIFDPSIYYFHKIPTIVHPSTVLWIMAGAVTIALLASILPARRAARLHPVEALRYE